MQTIKLNLIPGSVLPVVNVSQYDEKRQFALQVYEGATAYSLTGKTVEIRGTKPDGNGFAYDAQDGVVSVSGNTVTISTTQQMTAVGGQTMAELRITSGDTILGTLNFVLMVEPSALSDDTPISDTDIPAIERDFEAALEEAQEAAETATTKAGEAATSATSAAGSATSAAGSATTASSAATAATTKAGEASTSATTASTAATAAAADSLEAEGWAVGEQNGTPVGPTSPYYQNNAAYYADQAGKYATGGLIFKGSVAFANIPTTGMVNGDMYNITDDFTTDSRFIEGAGVAVKAGADIAWVAGGTNKWDVLATGGVSGVPSGGTTNQALAKNSNADGDTKWMDVVQPAELMDELRTAQVITGKNLWKPNSVLVTTTSADVKYTPVYTESGLIDYVDIYGTASGRSALIYTQYADNMRFAEGTYRMDVPVGIAGVNIKYRNDSNSEILLATVTPTNPNFTVTSAAANRPIMTEIVITSGTVMSHVKLYPMILTAADYAADPSYEPYYVPVKERKLDIEDEQVLGAWNTLKNDATTQTIEGATFTVNSDGTITINRASATANAALINITKGGNITETRESGTYYLSGVPSGLSGLTIQYYDVTDNISWNDSGNGATITVVKGHTVKVTARVAPNKTLSNVTIKPMIALKPNMPHVPHAMTNRELTDKINNHPSTTLKYTDTSQTPNKDVVFNFERNGDVVIIGAKNEFLAKLPTSWTSIGTLPEAYRPKSTLYCGMLCYGGVYVLFKLGPNGSVLLYASSAANIYAQGSCVYSATMQIV